VTLSLNCLRQKVKRFVVTRELVDNPVAELAKDSSRSQGRKNGLSRGQLVEEFARRFQELPWHDAEVYRCRGRHARQRGAR